MSRRLKQMVDSKGHKISIRDPETGKWVPVYYDSAEDRFSTRARGISIHASSMPALRRLVSGNKSEQNQPTMFEGLPCFWTESVGTWPNEKGVKRTGVILAEEIDPNTRRRAHPKRLFKVRRSDGVEVLVNHQVKIGNSKEASALEMLDRKHEAVLDRRNKAYSRHHRANELDGDDVRELRKRYKLAPSPMLSTHL